MLAEFRQSPVDPQLCGREEGRHKEVEGFLAVEEEEEAELGFFVGPTELQRRWWRCWGSSAPGSELGNKGSWSCRRSWRPIWSDSSHSCNYHEDDINFYECLNYQELYNYLWRPILSPLEDTAEDDADQGDAEHDDDAEVETEDVLDPLTVVQVLLRDSDAGPVPESNHSLIHVVSWDHGAGGPGLTVTVI